MTPTESALLAPTEPAAACPDGLCAPRAALEIAILGGEERPYSRSLEPGRYVVGSDRQCDIVVDADGVQPRHFLLVVGSHRAIIRTYGEAILLNKHLTNESSLAVGDRLWIGAVRIEVTAAGWEERPSETDSRNAVQSPENREASLPELMTAADEAVLVALDVERTRERSANESGQERARADETRRRQRRLQDVAELLQDGICDVVAEVRRLRDRAITLETHLAAAALVDERQAVEREELSRAKTAFDADCAKFAETRVEAERVLGDVEEQRQELESRERSLQERQQAVKEREEQICQREAEIENRNRNYDSARRRLTAEQEQVALDRVTLASEKASLKGEFEAIESRRVEIELLRSSLELQREAFQQAFAADYVAIEETRAVLSERDRELKAAEVEFAWRELALNDREDRVRELEAVIHRREEEQARTNLDNQREESSNQTPSNEAAMSYQTNDVELPYFDDLPPVDGDEGANASISALLGVQKVDSTSHVMDRLNKVEQMLELLLQRFPVEPDAASQSSETTVKDWRLAFKSPSVEEPRAVVIELEDAANSNSVSRYMEQLLIRMRAGNAMVPPPSGRVENAEEVAESSDEEETLLSSEETTLESASIAAPVADLREIKSNPRMKLSKEEQRAQNLSLREVANLSARQAISKHSLRRYKAELTLKAVISIVAFAIAVFFLTANVQSGNQYLWETIAAFGAVAVIFADFLLTLRRFPDTTSRGTSAAVASAPNADVTAPNADTAEEGREGEPRLEEEVQPEEAAVTI